MREVVLVAAALFLSYVLGGRMGWRMGRELLWQEMRDE